MALKAGSIYADTKINQKGWMKGLSSLKSATINGAKIIAAAFVGVMAVSVKKANDFQKEMSNVATVIDTTAISTQDLTFQLLKLDPALGDITTNTEAMYQAFSAGADTAEEAMEVVVEAAKFGKAALTDNAAAVDILTTAVNAYGKENMDAKTASDLFFTTIKEGKITGEQLASSIGTSIPLFASAKIDLAELNAGIAAMTKQGIGAAQATTQLNSIVSQFLQPAEDLELLMLELGYSSGSAFLEAEGLTGALEALETATGGDAAELAKLLPNIRAMKGAMALTGVGGEEFTDILVEMENSIGATDEAFAKQEKTFETFKNQMNNTLVVVGNIGKVFVDDLARGATLAAGSVLTFLTSSQGMNIIAEIAAKVAGGFQAITTGLKPLVDTVLGGLKELWDTLATAMIRLTGEQSKGAAASKIFAVIIKTLSAGFAVLIKVVEMTIMNITNLVNVMITSGKVVGDFFLMLIGKKTWDDVKDRAEETKMALQNLVVDGVVGFAELIDTTISEFSKVVTESGDLAEEIEIKYKTTFTAVKNNIISNFDEALTGQADFADSMGDANQALMDAMLESQNDYTNQTLEQTKNREIAWLDSFNKLVDEGTMSYKELKDELSNALEENFITEQGYAERSRQLWEDNWNDKIGFVEKYFDIASSVMSTGLDLFNTMTAESLQIDLDNLQYANELELSDLQDSLDQGIISQEQYDADKLALAETAKEEENALAKEIFEAKQKASKANAWLDFATSVMGWLSQAPSLGPVAGPIFAGVMTGFSGGILAKQLSNINKQTFTPRRNGGMADGLTRVHEDGGEIIDLPRGSRVYPHDISEEMAGGKGTTFNVYFNNPVVREKSDIDKIVEKVSTVVAQKMRLAR